MNDGTTHGEAMNPQQREAARRIETVLELVPDAMVIVDGDGRIRAMNSLVQKLLGYSREELIGQPVEVLLPRKFAATHPRHREAFAAKPRTRAMGSGMQLAARAKSGKEIPVEVSLRPVEGVEGMTVCAAIRDVTERHEAQEAARIAEQHLRFIVENSPDFALIQDRDLRYRWVSNPPAPWTAADYLGKTDEERVASGTVDADEAERMNAMRREVLASGTKKHWELETSVNGQQRYFEIVCGPLIDSTGKITGLASYTRDRTEQHHTLRDLEQARSVAEQASARNARFLAIASHDLRQPVQALSMLLVAARHAPSAGELWQRIDETMRSQSEMLDALLNMTKIESGNVALKIEVVGLAQPCNQIGNRSQLVVTDQWRKTRLDQILLGMVQDDAGPAADQVNDQVKIVYIDSHLIPSRPMPYLTLDFPKHDA